MQEKYLWYAVAAFVIGKILWDWLSKRKENGKPTVQICPLNQAGTIQSINDIKAGMGAMAGDISTVKHNLADGVERQKKVYAELVISNGDMLKAILKSQMIQEQVLDDIKELTHNLKTMSDTLIRLNGISRK